MLTTTGKKRITLAADLERIFRMIQSISSKKAEPVKRWLAEVGAQRIDQMIDPELTFQMAVEDYRRQKAIRTNGSTSAINANQPDMVGLIGYRTASLAVIRTG